MECLEVERGDNRTVVVGGKELCVCVCVPQLVRDLARAGGCAMILYQR
jgi:hypothetical protein